MITVAGSFAAIKAVSGALIGRCSTPNIIIVASSDVLGSNFIFGEDRENVEFSIFDKGCGSVVVIELKFPVAST